MPVKCLKGIKGNLKIKKETKQPKAPRSCRAHNTREKYQNHTKKLNTEGSPLLDATRGDGGGAG